MAIIDVWEHEYQYLNMSFINVNPSLQFGIVEKRIGEEIIDWKA